MPSHPKALSVFFTFLPIISLIAQSPETNSSTKLEPGFTIVADFAGDPKLIDKASDNPRPLQKGEKIPPSATIQSGTGGRVDLAMSNGALVQLLDNSKLAIGEFLQDPIKFVFSDGSFFLTQEVDPPVNSTNSSEVIETSAAAWNKLPTEPTTSKCKLLLSEGTIVGNSKKLQKTSKLEIETPIGTADIRGATWRFTVSPTDKANEFRGVIQISNGSIFFTKPDGTGSVSIADGYSLQFSAKVADQGNVVFYALSATPMSAESIQTLLTMVSEVESKQTYFKLGRKPNASQLASANDTQELNAASPQPTSAQVSASPSPTTTPQEDNKLVSDETAASVPATTPNPAEESISIAEESPAQQDPATQTASPQPTSAQVSASPSPTTTPQEEDKLVTNETAAPVPATTSSPNEESKPVAAQTPIQQEPAIPAPKLEPTSLNEDLASLSPQARELADLGSKLYKDKRFFDAVIIFRQALKLAPNNLFVIAHLAIAKIEVGKISDARAGLEKVIIQKPNDILVLTNLAIVYLRLKDFDKANASLKQILELDPQNAIAHNYMGLALGKTGKPKEAEDSFLRSITIDPIYAKPHFNLAVMYMDQKPPALDLARANYDKAKALGAEPDPKLERRLTSP
ncbi:MAG: tetratricopeptide repeat protein [Verrucomicrobia bacterium]|nr:tetratricopeptide repeat protein [Verrucomicrobiota bacterium]